MEDNPRDAELTLRALKKHNLANQVVHMKDGAEVLDYFFRRQDGVESPPSPKVILLDMKLPKADGLEVLRRLKSNPATATIPVVMLTSSKEDRDVKRSYELGVNSYIVKPVKFSAFVEAVAKLGFYWVAMNVELQETTTTGNCNEEL